MDDKPFYQRPLFSELPIPTESEVHEILTPHYPLLWQILMEPWDDFLERRGNDRAFTDMTEDESAQWLTMQAGHMARRLLCGNPQFRLLTFYNKLVIIVEDKFAITIKKLTKRRVKLGDKERLQRSNYLTCRNKALWRQRRGPSLPDYPRIIFGYQLLKELTKISLFIAYPRTLKRGVLWAYAVPDQSRIAPQIFEPSSVPSEDIDKGFDITAKAPAERDAEDKETGSNE
jgi:hypothetical protein